MVAIRSALLMEVNCSSTKFDTFPPIRDSDLLVVSNSSNSSIHQVKSFDAQDVKDFQVTGKHQLWVCLPLRLMKIG